MKRAPGWEQRLYAFTRGHLRTPYAWGTHDCALFAAGAIEVITGQDIASEWRGYEDEAGAHEALDRLGCDSVADLPERFGLEPCSPSEARRGDVVLVEAGEQGAFLAICDGATCIGPAARGLQHTPMGLATRAWRVG